MPSIINSLMLGEVTSEIAGAGALILIDSSRLKSLDVTKFRKELRGVGAELQVTKSSILYRVLPAEMGAVVPAKGPVAVVVIKNDVAAAAKLVNALVKEEKIAIKGGFLEGRALDAKAAAKLADLPTREQASALIIRTLNAPLVQLVRLLTAKQTELVRILKVKSEQSA